MSTAVALYGTSTSITMDLSALAASTTFIAGRESNEVDNTGSLFIDAYVSGRFIVGTTPTLPCQLNVYVWGSPVSLATTAIDVLDGADSAETLTNTTVLTNGLKLAAACPILVNTSNTTYYVSPFSVAGALGLPELPQFWGLFVSHNQTAALKTDAGNTNSFQYTGFKYTIS